MSDYHSGLATGMAMNSNVGNKALVDKANSSINGLEAVRDALVQALAEVAPDHRLIDKSARQKIFKDNYHP